VKLGLLLDPYTEVKFADVDYADINLEHTMLLLPDDRREQLSHGVSSDPVEGSLEVELLRPNTIIWSAL
jgi:hypothetical protein